MNLFNAPHKPSLAESYLLPILGVALIVIADRTIHTVLLTPMLSICLLGILAFRLEPRVLTFWFVVLILLVILALIQNPENKLNPDASMETVIVRSFAFMVAGSMAVAMNKSRFNRIRNHLDLLHILELFPSAVVVSDSTGTLLFANKKASAMLGRSIGDVIGLSFFTFFTSPEQRGYAIRDYLRIIEQAVSAEKTNLSYLTESKVRKSVNATQIPINLISHKCIVTVMESEPPIEIVQATCSV